jgi:hypothetical protein
MSMREEKREAMLFVVCTRRLPPYEMRKAESQALRALFYH